MERIGILGGTFDPVHRAHIACAIDARKQLGLDRLFLVPTRPWQKSARAGDEDRVAMLELACENYTDTVEIDRREIERAGQSYSIDTLYSFRKEYPQAAIFFILGSDQWKNLPTWILWEHFPELVNLAVYQRDERTYPNPYGEKIPAKSVGEFEANPTPFGSILLMQAPAIEVSSTEIRAHLKNEHRRAPFPNLDPKVQEYILSHDLYCNER